MGAENYKVTFYPRDEKEWQKFKDTGLELKVKTDPEDNTEYFQLRRPTKKVIKDEIIIFTPPEITGKVTVSYQDPEGNKIRQYNKHQPVEITRHGDPIDLGNGTEVLVNFSYYDTIKGKGHRLENITVLDLVEYDGPSGQTPQKVQPEPEVPEKTSSEKLKEDLNDDLPW